MCALAAVGHDEALLRAHLYAIAAAEAFLRIVANHSFYLQRKHTASTSTRMIPGRGEAT
jgi:hypothetical protein